MTTDIRGWVETLRPSEVWWDAAVRIRPIVDRQYGMFASLFGVRNDASGGSRGIGVTPVGRFRAIAPGRGTPPGASDHFMEEYDPAAVWATWVLWSEIAAIDWEEEGNEYIAEDPPHVVTAGPGPAT